MSEDLYQKPGPIQNEKVSTWSDYGYFVLKPNQREFFDYVKVDTNTWKYLKKWYGYDCEVYIDQEGHSSFSEYTN